MGVIALFLFDNGFLKMINAYLITNKACKPVSITDYKDVYKLIDCETFSCRDLELDDGSMVTLYMNEDALNLRGMVPYTEFSIDSEPVLGDFLVTGIPDEDGETTSAPENFLEKQLVKQKLHMIVM